MTTIKKEFQPIIEFLEANRLKKVSTILPELVEMVTSKVAQQTHYKDAAGNVVAIYCYYHKQWELLASTEYGTKASSTTGYNTMCKAGQRAWTRQLREAQASKAQLLHLLAEGKFEGDLQAKLAEIEAARDVVCTKEQVQGFANLQDALDANGAN